MASQGSGEKPRARRWLALGSAGVLLALVAGFAWLQSRHWSGGLDETSAQRHAAPPSSFRDPGKGGRLSRLRTPSEPSRSEQESAAPSAAVSIVAARDLGDASAESTELVRLLTEVKLERGAFSEAQAAQWRTGYAELLKQGATSVVAIRDFLRRGTQVDFGADGWRSVGYFSAREAMIDSLAQIGGAEALGVALETLQGNREPREIAMLAQILESHAPRQQAEAILGATREVLALAKRGELQGRDVGPVFEVYERYGGSQAVADLVESAGQWRYYATLTLAQLPDGAGVDALAGLAAEWPTPNLPALEALASVSSRYPKAREALLQQVQAERIPSEAWPYVAQALLGDEMQVADSVYDQVLKRASGSEMKILHVQAANENYYYAPTLDGLTPEQLRRRIALVEELRASTKDNESAQRALQDAQSILNRRLAAGVSPAPSGPESP